MIKVGLSGNRFSGKNEVCNMFRKISIPIFEADVVLKFIINHDMEINKQIRDKIAEMYGTSSRFISPSLSKTKEEIEIILDIAQDSLFKSYGIFSKKNESSVYTIFKSSVLFEKGWDKLMNYNISVFAPKITRMRRYQESYKKKITDVSFILKDEIDDTYKNRLSNFVVHCYDNYSGGSLKKQVEDIDQSIINAFLKSETPSRWSSDGKGIILTHF